MRSIWQWQHTLAAPVTLSGIGLHSGKLTTLTLLPQPADAGITFQRSDVPAHPPLRAHVSAVGCTALATTLQQSAEVQVSTVEHLLAALMAFGIDNAHIKLGGPEVPILDGSAAPWLAQLEAVGRVAQQPHARRYCVIKAPLHIAEGDKRAEISPGSSLRITCSLDFKHPLIPAQPFVYAHSLSNFKAQLAAARTFGFLHDVQALRARGLALGGSLDNAVVIDGTQVLNEGGLRFSDEFVRHKVLDAVGDLSLLGMPLLGHVTLHCPGHRLNTQLAQAILATPSAYEICTAQDLSEALEGSSSGALPPAAERHRAAAASGWQPCP